MNAINSITLVNFQSHGYTHIELAPGLNVITGPSDSGKSAIIRALRWALYNEPRGDAFMKSGAEGQTSAAIELGSGDIFERRRTQQDVNKYIVDTGEAELHNFESFGLDIPDEVTAVHRMAKAQFGDMEFSVNIGYQLDAPFLLSETASSRANILGKLAGTEGVDQASKLVGTDIHNKRTEVRGLEARVEEIEGDLEAFEHLPEMREQLDALAGAVDAAQEAQEKAEALEELMDRKNELRRGLVVLRFHVQRLQPVEQAASYIEYAAVAVEQLAKLEPLVSKWSKLQSQLSQMEELLDRLQPVDQAADAINKATIASEQAQRLESLRDRRVRLRGGLAGTQTALDIASNALAAVDPLQQVEWLVEQGSDLQRLVLRRQNLTKSLASNKNMLRIHGKKLQQEKEQCRQAFEDAGICPLCRQEIDHDHLEEVV